MWDDLGTLLSCCNCLLGVWNLWPINEIETASPVYVVDARRVTLHHKQIMQVKCDSLESEEVVLSDCQILVTRPRLLSMSLAHKQFKVRHWNYHSLS